MRASTTPRPSLTCAPALAHCARPHRPPLPARRATHAVHAMAAPTPSPSTSTKPVFALDFDGVACDSVGESATSAWIASERLWPALFAQPDVQAKKGDVLAAMRAVRPVIETGYENLVQVRCLVEGVGVEDMLAGWPAMLADRMAKWGLDRGEVS
jgi:hypothetical protein